MSNGKLPSHKDRPDLYDGYDPKPSAAAECTAERKKYEEAVFGGLGLVKRVLQRGKK